MTKDALGKRMKENYENRAKTYLTRRTPTIIRLDGKAFHTFTKGMKKPFDDILIETMQLTAVYLCEHIQGCKIAYTQSDEITLLLTDYDKLTTDAWFDYNVQKMTSVSASMATLAFNQFFKTIVKIARESNRITEAEYLVYSEKFNSALFDSRVFSIPKEEVTNCFIWRQQDATRNAIEMVGQANFSHKELHKKSGSQIQEMLWQEKGINFNYIETHKKRGSCIVRRQVEGLGRIRWTIDFSIPIFSQNREYIEQYL